MAQARKALFSQAQTFSWSNGDLFNGAAIIGLVVPTLSGTAATVWPQVNYGETFDNVPLPKSFAKIPITEGKLDSSLGLFYTSEMTPPNIQYIHYIMDSTNKVIAGPGTLFNVTSSPVTLPTLTLTVPSQTNAVAPVPD